MMTFRIRFLDIRPKKPGHQVRFLCLLQNIWRRRSGPSEPPALGPPDVPGQGGPETCYAGFRRTPGAWIDDSQRAGFEKIISQFLRMNVAARRQTV